MLNLSSEIAEKELELLAPCVDSTMETARLFFPRIFTRPFDQARRTICETLDRPDPYRAMAAFRGCGKTTTLKYPFCLKKIVFGGARYILYIGPDAPYAQTQTEAIKREFTANDAIKYFFGDVSTSEWTKDDGYTMNFAGHEVHILPRGNWQRVRGEVWRDIRPDVIIIDDLEKKIATLSEDQRMKTREWFYEDVLGCVDIFEDKFEFVWVGNILHADSTLSNLLEDPNWYSPDPIPLCDENLKSLVEGFTDADVQRIYQLYVDGGVPESFWREYAQMAAPQGKDAAFRKAYFKHYEEEDVKIWARPYVENVLIIDPSRSANPKSAPTGMVVVAFDPMARRFYLRDIIYERLHYDEMLDTMCRLIKTYNCVVVGAEVTGLKEFITYPFQNRIAQEGLNCQWVDCQARGGPGNQMKSDDKAKVRRSRPLLQFYRQGQMWHNKRVAHLLEPSLLSWPYCREWGVIDALAYLPEVLEIGSRYNVPQEQAEAQFKEAEKGFEAAYEALYSEDNLLPDYPYRQLV